MNRRVLSGLILLILTACNSPRKTTAGGNEIDPFRYESTKRLVAEKGAVVSAHPLASQAGIAILKKGGNAVDAAIATQLALAVVFPSAGNLGGGGFFVARLSDGRNISIDYREKAPAAAHRDMYIDADGNPRTDKSQAGHLSSGVPGSVAGLFAAHRFARLPFEQLIQPAIDLAEKGFLITAREAAALNNLQAELKTYNTVLPVFVKEKPWKQGDTLVQADLANTLKRIRDQGQAGFYEGETARLIVEEMKRGGGIISPGDLEQYEAKFREPHAFNYKGYRVIGMSMPSSGGVLLHQMMKMVEDRPLKEMGFHSVGSVQLMTEVERRAFADRGKYMGDADFFNVPVREITSDSYLRKKMSDYDPARATASSLVQPGVISPESEETTHFSVADHEGNAVSVTTTLNDSYGSKVVVGGAGFFLNDEMDDFSIAPGVPNMYGAIGGDANAIAPGKRMLSSMTPTIVLKEGKPFIIVGTPGGTTIPTSVFQTLVNILEFGLTAEEAVNRPKFHHQWLPDRISLERDFPETVAEELRKMGYEIHRRSAIGRTELILVMPDGKLEAVADKRGDDSAAGY